jgi:hypothetical protein
VKPVRENTKVKETAFRQAIWRRDGGIDRATGKLLDRVSESWDTLGQVCHLKSRGAYPELKYEISNAFLMNARFHWLSDSRGGRLLKILGEDANAILEFVMTDKAGAVLWRRSSSPP